MLRFFPNGILRMGREAQSFDTHIVVGNWIDSPLNIALVIVESFVLLFILKDILNICVSMGPCIQRWKPLVALEHNIHQSKLRDHIALCILPVSVMILQWSGLWGVSYLKILGGIAAYYVIKRLIYVLVPHRKVGSEQWRSCRNAATLFFILLTILWLFSVGFFLIINIPIEIKRWILGVEAGFCILLSFIRQREILSSQCGAFLSFLYLCALEIVPMAGLVCVILFVS